MDFNKQRTWGHLVESGQWGRIFVLDFVVEYFIVFEGDFWVFAAQVEGGFGHFAGIDVNEVVAVIAESWVSGLEGQGIFVAGFEAEETEIEGAVLDAGESFSVHFGGVSKYLHGAILEQRNYLETAAGHVVGVKPLSFALPKFQVIVGAEL